MKELDNQERLSEKQQIEAVETKKQNKELHLETRVVPHKNHRVWEINPETLSVTEADYIEESNISIEKAKEMIDSGIFKQRKVHKKPGMVYVIALSRKSARKRYLEGKGSAVIVLRGEVL